MQTTRRNFLGLAGAALAAWAVKKWPAAVEWSGWSIVAAQEPGRRTIYVSDSGSDNNDGLSHETAKRTLTAACVLARPGDTISVAPGEYYEPVAPVVPCTLLMSNCIMVVGGGNCCLHLGPTATDSRVTNCAFGLVPKTDKPSTNPFREACHPTVKRARTSRRAMMGGGERTRS